MTDSSTPTRAKCPNCGDVFQLTDEWSGYTCSQECFDEYVAYVTGESETTA